MAVDWDAEVLGPVMSLFGEGDLADPASLPIYTPRGGAPFPLSHAVFDAEFQHTTVNTDGIETTTHRPVLGVRLSLFATAPRQNDRVAIPSVGKAYVVKDVQPDGHGYVKLVLMEAAA